MLSLPFLTFAVVPVLLVLAVFTLVGRVKRREVIRLGDFVLLAVPLAIVAGAISLWMIIIAAMGHSQAAKFQALVVCLLTFALVVGIPLVGLLMYRRSQIERLRTGDLQAEETDEDPFDRRQKRIRNTALLVAGTLVLIVMLLVSQMGVWPPLHFALRRGYMSVAAHLIEGGSNPNERDRQGFSPLNYAVMKRNRSLVMLLLEKGADVNGSGGYQTPLISAIHARDLELVGLLLERGATPDSKTEYGPIPLCSAAGDPKMVSLLLEKGANVNPSSKHGIQSPLACACARNKPDSVRMILERNPDIEAKDSMGRTALMTAAAGGKLEIVRMLLEKGADPDAEDKQGETALSLGLQNRHKQVVDLLQSLGARGKALPEDKSSRKKRSRATAERPEPPSRPALEPAVEPDDLQSAVRGNRPARIEQLLDKGADINARFGPEQRTALMEAAAGGSVDLTKLLLSKGAEVNAKDKDGMTSLILAARKGHKDVIGLLIENRADLNIKDNLNRSTALEWAIWNGHSDAASLLITKGADVNAKGEHNITPLISAARRGNVKVTKLLLEHGSEVNVATKKGWTPLMWASEAGYLEVVELLLAKGADVNSKSNNGNTALSAATAGGHAKVKALLLKHGAKQ